MPKVTMPLGSMEAYGAVGDMMIFQGTSARAYVKPYDPRTGAQLDQRAFFRDVSKMIKAGNLFMRYQCYDRYGPRWFPELCRLTVENWVGSVAEWSTLTGAERTELQEKAPYQQTDSDAGMIWYAIHRAMRFSSVPFIELPDVDPLVVDDWLTWWFRNLDGVVEQGSYENGDEVMDFMGDWSVVNNASASGGSYLQKNGTLLAQGRVLFWGRQVRIVYRSANSQGSADCFYDSSIADTFSMYSAAEVFGNVYETEIKPEGLHVFTIAPRFVGGSWSPINIDRVEIL